MASEFVNRAKLDSESKAGRITVKAVMCLAFSVSVLTKTTAMFFSACG